MKLRHLFAQGAVDGDGDGSFLLTAKTGDTFSLSPGANQSQFQGWRRFRPASFDYLKVVEHLAFEQPITAVSHAGAFVARHYAQGEDHIAVTPLALLYEAKSLHGRLRLDLDIRAQHDADWQGRIHDIRQDGDAVTVTYRKFTDNALGQQAWAYTVVIKGAPSHVALNRWAPRRYAYDEARGDAFERYVYEALTIPIDGNLALAIAAGEDSARARQEAEDAYAHRTALLMSLAAQADTTATDAARIVAARALDAQVVMLPPHQSAGLFAGQPWFHQWWSRDELLSCRGLLLAGHPDVALDIVRRYAAQIQPDGRLPVRHPSSQLASADGIGWWYLRCAELLEYLRLHHRLRQHFTPDELAALFDAVERSLEHVAMAHGRGGLITCGPLDTWMDTSAGADGRAGAPLEIQALTAAGHRLAALLAQLVHRAGAADLHFELERALLRRIRAAYFDGRRLADRVADGPDWTCRPNLFLAYYAAPGLLTPPEWGRVFDWVLECLWLPWGGIASLEKDHPLHQPKYTGKDNRSYHRGDSWFFLNNLAGLALLSHGHPRFLSKVAQIYEASRHQLLFGTYLGHLAELSSAEAPRSEGCLAQTWSAATFLELHDALLPPSLLSEGRAKQKVAA